MIDLYAKDKYLMKYVVSCRDAVHHLIEIDFFVSDINGKNIEVQLPAWRPGRYELGNFAQHIKTFLPLDEKGSPLKFRKQTKDKWIIETAGNSNIQVHYSYYANELNAGSSFLDEEQLYINGVNCFIYVPEKIREKCELILDLPADYEVATALTKAGKYKFEAQDYHELVDSPFIASKTLQHKKFKFSGKDFFVWFQGDVQPDWKKIEKDFRQFIAVQLKMMKTFPFLEYHFLLQILPQKFYHGVEHQTSTVIALGPSYEIMKPEMYNELLGVSSHELFHAWNVKAIRPVEMAPYDYTKENYSRLGYVAEGITTYYGDLFLLRCGVFSEAQYFKTFNQLLDRHFYNYGRLNLSVADSSFDTWLDGYKAGVPGRKSSIYTEGALCAFMADVNIRRSTGNKRSLDEVMQTLYNRFGTTSKGYSEQDYKETIEWVAGRSFTTFFKNFYWGLSNYEPELKKSLSYLGLELRPRENIPFAEKWLGIKTVAQGDKTFISAVFPASGSDKKLFPDDEIISVNGIRTDNNFTEWCEYFKKEKNFNFIVATRKKIRQVEVQAGDYFQAYEVIKKRTISAVQQENFKNWSWR